MGEQRPAGEAVVVGGRRERQAWLTPAAIAWLSYGLVVTVTAPFLPAASRDWVMGLAQLAGCTAAVIGLVLLAASPRRNARIRLTWGLLAAAFTLLALGNLLIGTTDAAGHQVMVANLLFLLAYPLAILAFLVLPRVHRADYSRARAVIDATASVLGFLMLVVVLVVVPARQTQVAGTDLTLHVLQALGDVLLLVAAVATMNAQPIWMSRRVLGLAATAAALTAVADLTVAALVTHDAYQPGSLVDLGFVWALVAVGLAVTESMRVVVPVERRGLVAARPLSLLSIAATVVGAAVLLTSTRHLPWIPYRFLVVTATVITALTLTRAVLSSRSNAQLVMRLAAGTAALDQQRAYYHALVHSTSDVIFALDQSGRVREVSRSIEDVIGQRDDAAVGEHLATLLSPDAPRRVNEAIAAAAAAPGETVTIPCRIALPQGRQRMFDLTITDLVTQPDVANIVANLRDVSERNALLEQLARQAVTDTLTGLANRAALNNGLRRALAAAEGTDETVTALYCDLDGFKTVNDDHGHDVGDELLTVVAGRMRACIDPHDTLARIGGDEFVVVLAGSAAEERVRPTADRIVAACAQPVRIGELELALSTSIGVASSHGGGSIEDLLRRADQAMYLAKADGRNTVRFDASRQIS